MPVLQLDAKNGLYYEWDSASDGQPTFVFVNAITGDTSMWQDKVGPALRESGFGTLCYNFRGQANSPYAPDLSLDQALIESDLARLVTDLAIPAPILVGLSIGGLYAANVCTKGLDAAGLVLINTLRVIGPRIDWMNAGTLRLMQVAGPNLMRDVMTPLIFGPEFLAANRSQFLQEETVYDPMPKESGPYNLITWMGHANWDIAYENLQMPTLVLTGFHDRIFYEADVVDRLFDRLPNATRMDFPEAGHMIPVECPEKFTAALTDFASHKVGARLQA